MSNSVSGRKTWEEICRLGEFGDKRRFFHTKLKCLAFISALMLFCTQAIAATVDIYNDMENGSDETTLTGTIAGSGSHGTGGSWSVTGSAIKVSTDKETALRGPVTVSGGSTYTDSGSTRGWRVPDNVDGARAVFTFSSSKSSVVVSGYITIGPPGGSFELYDFIHVRHGGSGSVMQLNTGSAGNPRMNIEAYSPTTHSSYFTVVAGTTYWFSFKATAGGTAQLAFYETSGWTQVGNVSVACPSSNVDSIYFGVGSDHGNGSPTSTYFDDIIINWTDTTFPYLPAQSGGSQTAPTFTAQPSSQTVTEGQPATFAALATGSPSPTYQWQRNTGSGWINIPGATATSFTTAGTTLADDGDQFRCVANNSAGSITSSSATLAVNSSSQGRIFVPGSAPTNVWAQAGVPGGIPNRTTIYTTLNPGATAAQIVSAVNSCPSNQVVFLNAGTYNISILDFGDPGPTYRTLRGAGMGRTILNISSGAAAVNAGSYAPWLGSWANTQSVTAGGTQGSSTITIASATSYVVGDLCVVDMANADWIQGYGTGGGTTATYNNDSAGKGRDGNRAQLHLCRVTGKNGNALTIDPPLPYDLDSARSPQISRASTRPGPISFGIEDLTVRTSGSSTHGIYINGSYGSWLKNVELTGWGYFGVYLRWNTHFEMRGCYIHDPDTYSVDHGYGLQLDPVSGTLVIDNIIYNCQSTILVQGGSTLNVLAYNVFAFGKYVNGGYTGEWLQHEINGNHSPFPAYNLFEGNYTGQFQSDYYYGPSGWGMVFRNRIPGNSTATTQRRIAVSIDAFQRNYSIVGNQLGERTVPSSITLALPGVTRNYVQTGTLTWGYNPGSASFSSPYIFRLGYPYSGNNGSGGGTAVHDPYVKTNTLIHGNWDAANNAVTWDPSISDHNIPESLFLSGKPAWFGNLTWPPYGPSAPSGVVSDLSKIPAGYRLLYNANPPTSTNNQPPTAVASATPLSGAAPLTVAFSSTGSLDPEGTPLSYSWVFGDGGTSSAANPSHTYTANGTYVARLTVSDGVNSASSPVLTVVVTGIPVNQSPIAVASATPLSGAAPLTVAFSSTGSLDPEGTPLSYSWVFGDGGTSSAANPSHTYTANGTYVARLTVSDGTNSTQSAPITIAVVTAGSSLVAAYGFEEGSGGSVADVSGYNNTGTLSGATWTGQGRYGKALNFNGTDGMVVVNSSASLNLSSAMTLEAWVYPTISQSSWSSILHRQPDMYYLHASSPAGAMIPAGGGVFNGVESYCPAASAIPLNTWTHLAATFDGSVIRFYVNGVQVSTQAASGAIQTGSNPLRIGGNTYNQFFQGRIDEVRIYSRALSAGEIVTDMNTPVSAVAPNPAPPTNLRTLSSN